MTTKSVKTTRPPRNRENLVVTVTYDKPSPKTRQFTLRDGHKLVMVDRNRLKRAAQGLLTKAP